MPIATKQPKSNKILLLSSSLLFLLNISIAASFFSFDCYWSNNLLNFDFVVGSHYKYNNYFVVQGFTATTATPSFLNYVRQRNNINNNINMGLSVSLFQDCNKIANDNDDDNNNNKSNNPNYHNKKKKTRGNSKKVTQKQIEWKRIVDEFTGDALHSDYIHLPVRWSTVDTAAGYSNGVLDQPGLMPGSHKHLGGAYDPTDGCIYGVPAHSRAILCIYMDSQTNNNDNNNNKYRMKTIPLPSHIASRQFKWLRGIIHDGYLWAIPSWANAVLCVDIDAYWGRRKIQKGQSNNNVVQLIDLPSEYIKQHGNNVKWQWHGAAMNLEKTAIYCIPANAEQVLKVDIATKTTSLIDIVFDKKKYPDFSPRNCKNKFYGGIVGEDNAIYGMPYRACGVLRIDSKTDTATLVGPNYGIGNYYWHGGIKVNGKIYAHPSHANTVLVIDTNQNGICTELPIHHRPRIEQDGTGVHLDPTNTTYKWLGGNVGADGNIYCPACDTTAVLKINVTTDYCSTFGFAGTIKNKWQGGVFSSRDKCIYCIPAGGIHVLRIATDPDTVNDAVASNMEENLIQLIGSVPTQPDKWQGGAEGLDGSLYFIPENGYRVLRVVPAMEPPKFVNGKFPKNENIRIEML